jgi:YidC/Oxa1 family membrane protein insertase
MDKKFLISVGLSLATVWALQYYWYKPTPATSEVSLKSGQVMPKPGEAVKVPVREDIFKPMKTATLFEAAPVGEVREVVIDMPQRVVKVSSSGNIASLEFKQYLNATKQPLKTITSDAMVKGIPAFSLFFDEAAPTDYTIVSAEHPKINAVTLQAKHQGWLVTKEYRVDQNTFKIDLTLKFEPLEQNAAPISPRLFVKAPEVAEFKDDQPSTFIYNEHRNEVEKKSAGAEEGLLWYWQTQKAMIGAQNKYFVHALTGDLEQFVQRAYFCRVLDGKSLQMVLEGPLVKEKAEWNLSFYLGPKIHDELIKVDDRLGTVFAGGWFAWLTKLMLKFLDFISKYVKNLGLAIIVLAVLLKLPLVPLSIYSRIKMERYQKHAPIISRIRAKYRGDQQAQLQEVTRYHQEHNISPSTPMIGCLPLILQLPIMYSLYDILNNSLQLYQAPFFGWIVDLSAKDPFYVIPVLMGISMIWQQMMAPVNDEKQRIAMFFVSIVMTVVFSGLPVGLVLYWLINNLLTIIEDYARRLFFS